MFTQCPKCHSVFMISDNDAHSHEGLVRCGNCYSVFNSSWNMIDDPRTDKQSDKSTRPVTTDSRPASRATPDTPGITFRFISDDDAPLEAPAAESTIPTIDGPVPDNEEMDDFPDPDFNADKRAKESQAQQQDESLLYFGDDTEEDDVPLEAEPFEDTSILHTTTLFKDHEDEEANTVTLSHDEDDAVSYSDNDMWPSAEDLPAESEGESTPVLILPDTDIELSENKLPASGRPDEEAIVVPANAGSHFSHEVAPLLMEEQEEGDIRQPDSDPDDGPTLDATASSQPIPASQETALPTHDQHDDVVVETDISVLMALAENDDDFDESMPINHTTTLAGPPALDDNGSNDSIQATVDDVNDDANTPSATHEQTDEGAAQGSTENTDLIDNTLFEQAINNALSTDDAEDTEQLTAEDFFAQLNTDSYGQSSEEIGHPDEVESVFITSADDEPDEIYSSITVEPHATGGNLEEFPLPDDIADLGTENHDDINELVQEAHKSKDKLDKALPDDEIDADSMDEIVIATPAHLEDRELTGEFAAEFVKTDGTPQQVSGTISNTGEKIRSLLEQLSTRLPFLQKWSRRTKTASATATATEEDHDETRLIRSLRRRRPRTDIPGWLSPAVQISSGIVLALLLLFQVGYFYMDELVSYPSLRPVLQSGCNLAGCNIPPEQHPELIDQLASKISVIKDREGGMKVSATLINRGEDPQPFPPLELTLTDRTGNLISRRVITTEQYRGSASATDMMPPGRAEDIDIRFRSPSIRVDGFELRPVKPGWRQQL